VQQLPGVVPFVDRLADVDAVVALDPQEGTARPPGQDLGDLGLADPGLALQQEWSGKRDGQEDGGGQALVGEVPVLLEGREYLAGIAWAGALRVAGAGSGRRRRRERVGQASAFSGARRRRRRT
jgi:hypothetical protein